MKGILADVHMGSYVEALVREMQSEYWADLWKYLGLTLHHFEVGSDANLDRPRNLAAVSSRKSDSDNG